MQAPRIPQKVALCLAFITCIGTALTAFELDDVSGSKQPQLSPANPPLKIQTLPNLPTNETVDAQRIRDQVLREFQTREKLNREQQIRHQFEVQQEREREENQTNSLQTVPTMTTPTQPSAALVGAAASVNPNNRPSQTLVPRVGDFSPQQSQQDQLTLESLFRILRPQLPGQSQLAGSLIPPLIQSQRLLNPVQQQLAPGPPPFNSNPMLSALPNQPIVSQQGFATPFIQWPQFGQETNRQYNPYMMAASPVANFGQPQNPTLYGGGNFLPQRQMYNNNPNLG